MKRFAIVALLAAGVVGCTATVVPVPGGSTDRTVVERNNTQTVVPVAAPAPTNVKVTVPAPAPPPQTNVKVVVPAVPDVKITTESK